MKSVIHLNCAPRSKLNNTGLNWGSPETIATSMTRGFDKCDTLLRTLHCETYFLVNMNTAVSDIKSKYDLIFIR